MVFVSKSIGFIIQKKNKMYAYSIMAKRHPEFKYTSRQIRVGKKKIKINS